MLCKIKRIPICCKSNCDFYLMALSPNPDRLTPPVSSRDRCQGNSTAKITLVQYGDYQCPICQAAYGIIPSIQAEMGDRLRFVFRHFPQSQIHPEAYHAAEATEAAAAQNKFWEMHTCLFDHPSQLADSNLVEYAIALDLDVDRFLQEMSTDQHVARVQSDLDSGIHSGVISTPTFFINGVKYNDERSLETLRDAVLQADRQ
jgi:protein-disulfide isomerase